MPVSSYAPRQKTTGIRSRDAVNPLFVEAEARVHRWLVDAGYRVVDARAQRTYYDFRIGKEPGLAVYTLDVKCDQYASNTGMVAWETNMWTPSRKWAGWGMDEKLDYVAYALPHVWTLLLVRTTCVRKLLARIEAGAYTPQQGEVKPFVKEGRDGYHAAGLVLSIPLLRREGCVAAEDKLPELE